MAAQLPESLQRLVDQQVARTIRGRERFNPAAFRSRYLHSSYLFAPGLNGSIAAGTYDVFVNVKGDIGQGYGAALTDRETNWEGKGGNIPDWQNLVIWEIGVDVRRPPTDTSVYAATLLPAAATNGKVDLSVPVNAIDVARFSRNTALFLNRGPNRSENIGLVADYPSVGGISGGIQAGRQTPITGSTGISGTPTDGRAYLPITRNAVNVGFGRRLKVPWIVGRQDKFSMRFTVPKAIPMLGVNGATAENNDASGALEACVTLWVTEGFNIF